MSTAARPTPVGQNSFERDIENATGGDLRGASIQTIQVSLGLKCNLACRHCHLESSPRRTEQMDWPTMKLVLDAARGVGAQTLDITGGAPEMHPQFRQFVGGATEAGAHVMVRTNLTVMLHEGYRDLPEFFREHRTHLVASLPCYLEHNVDRQRGKDVYPASITVLKRLNEVGYGADQGLRLDLVYNPLGPTLPPSQADLENAYRRELGARYGITFTKLNTMINMPIGRFLSDLRRTGAETRYRELLKDSFNAQTVTGLMCRHQMHVGYDGTVYDCDFNYALGVPLAHEVGTHIRNVDPATFAHRCITTGEHCYGCTAGAGSSCIGALL